MEFVLTLGLFAFCMSIMAIGLLFKRKPIVKDCGLDPISGERITDCACAAQGKPTCFKKKVLSLFESESQDSQVECTSDRESSKVVDLPKH
ncbi:MAG: hypothetical protein KC931_09155 [Candidatus Omnitrophica bacterium]|nr:hypothetical protein [Candidatus Omnitrophota bacterium]MCA9429715.1 hypothetical protein [Candidatus Omnitrophota bacterium]MCA9436243.1 hypothetical protein [Candidatus Omnitrophota bacterium]MCA9440253.1 hypothetical protein [Candidatus Omnitrophota bacterium]MCA9447274.1 hypothetical protein [Candidatus Omnitrophota bacterium]